MSLKSKTKSITDLTEEKQYYYLKRSVILSILITSIFLGFLYFNDFLEKNHSIPFGIYYLSHFIALLLIYRRSIFQAIAFLSGGPLLILIISSYIFPQFKFESLFFLVIAFFGLNVIVKDRLSWFLFYVFSTLCLIFQVYESYFEPYVEIDSTYAELNKVLFILFLAFMFVALFTSGKAIRNVKSDLQHKEKNLQVTKLQIQSIFKSALDGMFIYNVKEDRIIDGNASFRTMFGFEMNEKISHHISVLPSTQPDGSNSQNEIHKYLKKVTDFNKTIRFEMTHQRLNGDLFLAESTIIPSSENPDELYVFIKDISAIRKTQNQLKSSRKWYKSIIESNPSGISVINRNGDHLYASVGSSKIFGVPKEKQSEFTNAYNLFPESEHEAIKNIIDSVFENQQFGSDRFRTINQTTKEELIVSIHFARMDQVAGEFLAISINDITELVHKERKIIEGQATLKAVMDSSPDAIYSIDKDYNILSFNNKAKEEFKSININLEVGVNLADITEPETFENWKENIFNRIFRGESFNISGEVQTELSIKTVQNFYSPVLDINGNIIGAMETSRDITKDRLREQKIQEQKAIYEAVINNSSDGIDIVDITNVQSKNSDTEGTLIIRNREMKRIFNDDNSPLLFWDEIENKFPVVQPNKIKSKDYFEDILSILMNQGLVSFPIRFKHDTDHHIDTSSVSQILRINGKTLLIRSYKDVTEQIIQENLIQDQLNKLNHQNEKLKTYISSNLELENFAYIASHDLQAPLRTITSFTQLLKSRLDGKLNEDEEDFMNLIVDGTKSMQELINALLTFSRVNTTKINKKEIDLNKVLEGLLIDLTSEIKTSGAEIEVNNLPANLFADRIKLKQLFQNLITNGIKFVPKGTAPKITVFSKEYAEYWTFSVKDNGIGIKEEFQEKIFLLFKRLHTQKEFEGTGIGLALCKKLVEQHGGELSLDSTFGEGSTFTFTIPKEEPELP